MDETVIFLDVDGVFSPIGEPGAQARREWGDWQPAAPLVWLSHSMAKRLDSMQARIIWLTSWEFEANTLCRYVGWPGREVIERVEADIGETWWKLEAADRWLDRHPSTRRVAWLDDDLAETGLLRETPNNVMALDRLLPKGVDALLIAPERTVGLTRAHLNDVERFCSDE